MRKNILILISIVFTMIFIGLGYRIFAKDNEIVITKIAEVNSNSKLEGGWWFQVCDSKNKYLSQYGISIPKTDFNKNYLIISNGREIIKMKRIKKGTFPFKETHFAEAIFGKELHSDTWFIYSMPSYRIFADERINSREM